MNATSRADEFDPDRELRERVHRVLSRQRNHFDHALAIGACDGVVTIAGEVATRSRQDDVIRAILAVPGVTAVADLLTEPPERRRSVASVTVDIAAALRRAGDPRIKADVRDGLTTLTGVVLTQQERAAGNEAIIEVPGVGIIENRILVRAAPTVEELRGSIRLALISLVNLESGLMEIRLNGTEAHLTGAVATVAERDAAEHAAWSTGVTRVCNDLTITPLGLCTEGQPRAR